MDRYRDSSTTISVTSFIGEDRLLVDVMNG